MVCNKPEQLKPTIVWLRVPRRLFCCTNRRKDRKKRAEEAGVKLKYTAFAREAFVFIVDIKTRLIHSLLANSRSKIFFSGKVSRWNKVGGGDESKKSGSGQKILEAKRLWRDWLCKIPQCRQIKIHCYRSYGRFNYRSRRLQKYTIFYWIHFPLLRHTYEWQYAQNAQTDQTAGYKWRCTYRGKYPVTALIRTWLMLIWWRTKNPTLETQKFVDWF